MSTPALEGIPLDTWSVHSLADYVRCRNQKEWVCDKCLRCGDKECCPGSNKMFRVPKTDDCLCSDCMESLK